MGCGALRARWWHLHRTWSDDAGLWILFLQTMLVAVFLAHGDDPFGKMEKGLLFATFSLMLMGTGAGRFSVDKLLVDRLPKA